MSDFFSIDKTNRQWHLPIVAGLCVGIPVLLGWTFDNLSAGKLASLAGLGILYIQSDQIVERMILLMTCCFGILASYSLGLLFAFSPVIAPYFLGVFAGLVHYVLYRLGLNKPPGNFFFIMLASVAVCTPFDEAHIPEKIGYIAMGTILTGAIGLVYSLCTLYLPKTTTHIVPIKNYYTNLVESVTFGLFVGLSLAIASFLHLETPYWVPVSCAAVMQGATTRKVSMRALQRIAGTFAGLGITWLIFTWQPPTIVFVLGIMLLQIIVEFLVVRNYAIAAIFITILTIFLAEADPQNMEQVDRLFASRLIDIVLGSIVGIIGGWVLYNQKMHYHTILRIRKAKIWMKKKK